MVGTPASDFTKRAVGVMAIYAYVLMVTLALLTTFAFLDRNGAADDN